MCVDLVFLIIPSSLLMSSKENPVTIISLNQDKDLQFFASGQLLIFVHLGQAEEDVSRCKLAWRQLLPVTGDVKRPPCLGGL